MQRLSPTLMCGLLLVRSMDLVVDIAKALLFQLACIATDLQNVINKVV